MVKYSGKSFSLSDLWVSSHEKQSDFYVSSWQRGGSPVPLLLFRLVLAALSVGILLWSVIVTPNLYYLIYLTDWGLILLALMTLSSLLVSCMAVCTKLPDGKKLPWYISMYWLLYNISVSIAIMITALYWTVLHHDPVEGEPKPDLWFDIFTHCFNSCIVIAEVLVSRTPVRLLHMYQPLGAGVWYALFSVIYYAVGAENSYGNPFIYNVLDWREADRAGAMVGFSLAGLIVVYTALWGLALCRDKISAGYIRTTSHDLPTPPDPDTHARTV